MKPGDKVKALVQIGLMREPRWLQATLVEGNTVDIHGNRLLLERGKIKGWRPLQHDETGCPKVKEFARENWDEVKRLVNQATEHFLPNDTVVFDEENNTIEIDGFTLQPSFTEMETIAEFKEIPCWVASYWVTTYSHSEPPDADEVICGHAGSPDNAARLLIDTVLKERANAYWESVSDAKYAQYLEG